MRLRKVRLRNFRCYKDETSFDISDLTVFAGRNDVGKSTVFDALNIFFEEGKIDADDACTLKAIFEYIEVFYNRKRKHSTLGYKTPNQFEQTMKSAVCF